MSPAVLILSIPPILLALTFHEYAHAWVADRLGDPTARYMGRKTLNPLAHLDLLGTVMIFLVHFGWAKPVPVNPANLKNPRRDMLWISAAGPGMNMLLAAISGLLLRWMMGHRGLSGMTGLAGQEMLQMLYLSLYINLALAVFNLIPIPPLDGSKILAGLLPPGNEGLIYFLETRGPMLLFGLVFLGMMTNIPIFGFIITPFVRFFSYLFAGI